MQYFIRVLLALKGYLAIHVFFWQPGICIFKSVQYICQSTLLDFHIWCISLSPRWKIFFWLSPRKSFEKFTLYITPFYKLHFFLVLITKYLRLRIESSNQLYTFASFCDSSFIVIANSILLMSFSDGLLLWFSFLLSNGILREIFYIVS